MLRNTSDEFPGSTPYAIPSDEKTFEWSFLSNCIHIFLYMAGLSLLWVHKVYILKLWIYLDCTFLSVMFPSVISKEKLLAWAQSRLPSNWSSQSQTLSTGLSELWQDGSLLCTLINTAVPGACANPHRHWNKPPIHAQDLAFKYLGVIPVFTEFEYQYPLSVKTERKFFHYLNLLRNKINNVSTKNSSSQEISKWYVARGMGLYAGEQCKNAIFYIYPQITLSYYYNILIYIRGPYSTNGQIEFSHMGSCNDLNFAQSKELLTKIGTTENIIDKFRSYNAFQNKFDKEFIKMSVKIEDDRAKVIYFPAKSGIYEIFITCNGEPIAGSPFYANIFGTIPIKNLDGKDKRKISDRKFSAEYYIRQTKMVSVQNNLNKTDDQKTKKYDNNGLTPSVNINSLNSERHVKENDPKQKTDHVNSLAPEVKVVWSCPQNTVDGADKKKTENINETVKEPEAFYSKDKQYKKRDVLMELTNYKKSESSKANLKRLCHITLGSLAKDFISKVPENKNHMPKNLNSPLSEVLPNDKPLHPNKNNSHCSSPICLDHIVSEEKRIADNVDSPKKAETNKMLTKRYKITKSASSICEDHIGSRLSLSKSISDVYQLGARRDSMTSLRSFETDTQSFICSESDFDTLEQLRELNSTPSGGSKIRNLSTMVLEKKLFWETLANHPEIIKTTNNSSLLTSKALSKSMSRLEEFKNYLKNHKNSPWFKQSKNRFKLSKSVDDLRCSGSAKNMSKFKTADRSLADCSKLPVDERKQIYLKELENLDKKKDSKSFEESIYGAVGPDFYGRASKSNRFQNGSKKSVHFQQSGDSDDKIIRRKCSSLRRDPRTEENKLPRQDTKTYFHKNRFKSSLVNAIATFSRSKVAPECWDDKHTKLKIKKRPSLRSVFNGIY